MKNIIIVAGSLLLLIILGMGALVMVDYYGAEKEPVITERANLNWEVIWCAQDKGPVLNSDEQVIDHDYDVMVSLGWGSNSSSDVDLHAQSSDGVHYVSYKNTESIIDEANGIWLDYDYIGQSDQAKSEIVTIQGMDDQEFVIKVFRFAGDDLSEDPEVQVKLPSGETKQFEIDKEILNKDLGVTVCKIKMATAEVVEVLETFELYPMADPKAAL